MTQSANRKIKKTKLLEVFVEKDVAYVVSKRNATKKEWDIIIGVYSTLLEMVRKKDKKWIN